MTTENLPAVQASLGHTEIRMTQRYAKAVVLLSSEMGEKLFPLSSETVACNRFVFSCFESLSEKSRKKY